MSHSGPDEANNFGGKDGINTFTRHENNFPTWKKYTKSYTDFSTADPSNSIELFTMPAGGVIHAVKIKHSTAFSGEAISAYTISVGITGSNSRYAPSFDTVQAVSGEVLQMSSSLFGENQDSSWSVTATAVATGANLDAATTGSVDIWVLTSKTPTD